MIVADSDTTSTTHAPHLVSSSRPAATEGARPTRAAAAPCGRACCWRPRRSPAASAPASLLPLGAEPAPAARRRPTAGQAAAAAPRAAPARGRRPGRRPQTPRCRYCTRWCSRRHAQHGWRLERPARPSRPALPTAGRWTPRAQGPASGESCASSLSGAVQAVGAAPASYSVGGLGHQQSSPRATRAAGRPAQQSKTGRSTGGRRARAQSA